MPQERMPAKADRDGGKMRQLPQDSAFFLRHGGSFAWLALIVLVAAPISLAIAAECRHPDPWLHGAIVLADLLLAAVFVHLVDASQRRYLREKAFLESVGDGVIVTDSASRIVSVNPQAEKLLGIPAAEAFGKMYAQLVPMLDEKGVEVPLTFRPILYALKTGKRRSISTVPTYYYVRPDNRSFPVACTAAPIVVNGAVQGAVAVFRDISAEKEIDRAKSEFVSVASHQLLAPISAVRGYARLLSDGDLGPVPPKQKETLLTMQTLVDRMTSLVEGLLNVSRIELGTFSVEPQPTSFGAVAKNVVAELQPQISARKIRLAEYVSADLPQVNVDPNLLGIIIQNLLSNAIRYTREGGTVSMSIQSRPSVVAVIVRDEGIGIPQAEQSKIFTKFYRADNARAKVENGNGLGLYIVKSILDHTGGRIWFVSEEGKGTTFYVTIPLEGMKARAGTKKIGYTE